MAEDDVADSPKTIDHKSSETASSVNAEDQTKAS
jgi:sec-independent protein translocase protein TatA